MTQRPLIGIGVLIAQDNKILLGKRKNSHGDGHWSPPGGHLEFNESLEQCAKREVLEETGLIINHVFKGPYTNDIFEKENKHYVSIFMLAKYTGGQPIVLEPEKCYEWQWFSLSQLPENLFIPLDNLIRDLGLLNLEKLISATSFK